MTKRLPSSLSKFCWRSSLIWLSFVWELNSKCCYVNNLINHDMKIIIFYFEILKNKKFFKSLLLSFIILKMEKKLHFNYYIKICNSVICIDSHMFSFPTTSYFSCFKSLIPSKKILKKLRLLIIANNIFIRSSINKNI